MVSESTARRSTTRRDPVHDGNVVLTRNAGAARRPHRIYEDKYGFQKGVAYAARAASPDPARNARAGTTTRRLSRSASTTSRRTKSPNTSPRPGSIRRGRARRDYIWYDPISEKYLVNAGKSRRQGPAARVPRGDPAAQQGGRIRSRAGRRSEGSVNPLLPHSISASTLQTLRNHPRKHAEKRESALILKKKQFCALHKELVDNRTNASILGPSGAVHFAS
jgi:hypothetical protein